MRKILTIFAIFLLFSCSDEPEIRHYEPYKKFHTKNKGGALSYENLKENHRKGRRIPPSESMALGLPKKKERVVHYRQNKESSLSSIKSQNHSRLVENFEVEPFDLHGDFDEIFVGGRYVGNYKIGNPYEIEGVPYYPQEYEDYEEVGVASWYGEQFDGKMTANGEIYNLSSMTAAHQTLPLPSIVRVTNLENGKSVLVRVNDRGPFAKNRIIDLSKKAADKLDYRKKGTTVVKVEYLPDETEQLLKSLRLK